MPEPDGVTDLFVLRNGDVSSIDNYKNEFLQGSTTSTLSVPIGGHGPSGGEWGGSARTHIKT